MTVAEAIRIAAERLAPGDTARFDAELLMAHALEMSRSDMLLRAMRDPAPAAFSQLIERRMAQLPGMAGLDACTRWAARIQPMLPTELRATSPAQRVAA